MESLLGNMMLTYKKGWKKHFFDVLALAELQKETYTGYYTTVSNFSTDKFGYNNLQAGAVRLWGGQIRTTNNPVSHLLWDVSTIRMPIVMS